MLYRVVINTQCSLCMVQVEWREYWELAPVHPDLARIAREKPIRRVRLHRRRLLVDDAGGVGGQWCLGLHKHTVGEVGCVRREGEMGGKPKWCALSSVRPSS